MWIHFQKLVVFHCSVQNNRLLPLYLVIFFLRAPLYLVINNDQCPQAGSVQLGFLPREVAKWVAPLSDSGLFNFSGFIYPREALEAAFGVTNTKVHLLLSVSKIHQKVSKRPFFLSLRYYCETSPCVS